MRTRFLVLAGLALGGALLVYMTATPPPTKAPADSPQDVATGEHDTLVHAFIDEGVQLAAPEPSVETLSACAFPVLELPYRVVGTIAGRDPYSGVASIGKPDGSEVRSLRPGDEIDKGIGLVAVLRTKIVVRKGGTLGCLLAHWFSTAPSPPARPAPSSATVNEPGLEVDGPNTKVSRALLDELTGPRLAETLSGCLVTPVIEDGQVTGYRMSRIKDASIYHKLGMKDGDLIRSINDVPLGDAAQVISLLKGLKQELSFSLVVERDGTRETRRISVQ